MNELLVNRLRIARTESGLKQQDVADKLGIKANTIGNWEKGRTEPDIDTFVKLCVLSTKKRPPALRQGHHLLCSLHTGSCCGTALAVHLQAMNLLVLFQCRRRRRAKSSVNLNIIPCLH